MSDKLTVSRATFRQKTGGGDPFTVHFNPASLQLTLQNNVKQGAQYVESSNAKLSMELVFDTTGTGADVRTETGKVAAFMTPTGTGQHRIPPVIVFDWGAFSFEGFVEQYRETIDFFSHQGVPLRATVSLTLARQDLVFGASGSGGPANRNATDDGTLVVDGAGRDQALVGGGSSSRMRDTAAANGLDTPRFPTGPISVDASVRLSGPAAFASGGLSLGASAGASAGASFGASLGASLGASAGASFGASAGIGAGVSVGGPGFGASASAGVSASAGAFAGLRSPGPAMIPALDPSRLVPRVDARVTAPDGSAGVRVGGRANVSGSASLSADVGAGGGLSARLQFET